MGVKNLSSLLEESSIPFKTKMDLPDFKGQFVALDAFNVLYQFLSSIRDPQGNNLTDKEGRITSHLIGLLTRTSKLIQYGIKPIYVFDGDVHPLKKEELSRRSAAKDRAKVEYDRAIKEGDMVRARSLGQRINRLDSSMVEDSKKLLECMGIPVIQAPGEGEAQAAQLAFEGKADTAASQDYDALLFGTPILTRNLNITGVRNLPRGRQITINPENYNLKDLLKGLDITREQLIDLGILLGSDFNPNGFKGVGVKTAFKFLKKHGDFETVAKNEKKVDSDSLPYQEIVDIFLKPNVEKNVEIKMGYYDPEKILNFLVGERGFSEDRYKPLLDKTLRDADNMAKQQTLDDFF